MSDEHTPTPWGIPIYDNDTGPNDEGFYEWFEIPGVGKFDKMSDALFVYRACNAHDALVSALEEVKLWIDNWSPDFISDEEWPDTEKKIDAALALAKGE